MAVAMLREAYTASNRQTLSARLDRLEGQLGVSRRALVNKAWREGVHYAERRPWSPTEKEYLRASAGTVTVPWMARHLGRSQKSVRRKLERLQISLRVTDGYNIDELAAVIGQKREKVARWMERGLLGTVRGLEERSGGLRVSDRAVVEFLRKWPHEYDLRRVDQIWYKAMIFGVEE